MIKNNYFYVKKLFDLILIIFQTKKAGVYEMWDSILYISETELHLSINNSIFLLMEINFREIETIPNINVGRRINFYTNRWDGKYNFNISSYDYMNLKTHEIDYRMDIMTNEILIPEYVLPHYTWIRDIIYDGNYPDYIHIMVDNNEYSFQYWYELIHKINNEYKLCTDLKLY